MGSLSLCSLLFWSSEVEENHTFSWVQKKVLFLSFLLWENWDECDFESGLEIAYKLSFGFAKKKSDIVVHKACLLSKSWTCVDLYKNKI